MVGNKITPAGVLSKFCSDKSIIFVWTQSTIVFGNSEMFSTYWRGVHLWRSVRTSGHNNSVVLVIVEGGGGGGEMRHLICNT